MTLRHDIQGGRNPNARLSRDNVLMIRRRHAQGVTQRELARVYGVSGNTIANIIHRTTWGWLEDDGTGTAPWGDDVSQVVRTPEEQAALDAEIEASATRFKALLVKDEPVEISGNRPFIYPFTPKD